MRICKLEPDPKRRGRWLVLLEDETELRVTDAEMADFSLYAGMELSRETRARLTAAASARLMRQRAADLIAVRPMSRTELLKKLGGADGKQADREAAADFLERMGLLNDAEYARTVAAHYAAKGYGIYKIRSELYRRGVPRQLWEDALSELPDPAEAIDAFIGARLKSGAGARELHRCADALARRGFAYGDIREALQRYENPYEE